MAKMNREEFEKTVFLFDNKKLRENKITMLFMDLYVANKGTEEELKEYSLLADNDNYLKDISLPKPNKDGETTRKGRDVEKIRQWFFDKYAPGYQYKSYNEDGKASDKLAQKLSGMKF